MKFTDSLKKNRDFQNVYKHGRSRANKYFIMYILENDRSRNHLGISVSKKVGNSVVRHRIKRLVLENYRLREEMFNSGLDIAVIARPAAKGADFYQVRSAIEHLASLHGIMQSREE